MLGIEISLVLGAWGLVLRNGSRLPPHPLRGSLIAVTFCVVQQH